MTTNPAHHQPADHSADDCTTEAVSSKQPTTLVNCMPNPASGKDLLTKWSLSAGQLKLAALVVWRCTIASRKA